MTTEAFINPTLLRWARERERESIGSVAEGMKLSREKVEAWERGDQRPTIRQAQKLARRLGVPFGYLYLSSPPTDSLPLPDLRTIGDQPPSSPSPDFSALLNDVLNQHEWYRAALIASEADPLPFVGRFTSSSAPEAIAAEIRETFQINDSMRSDAANWDEFLRILIRQVEEKRVLVLRSGVVGNNNNRKLSVEEFRGFAISDSLAPLVFINSQDAKSAQIFTLVHELAHLFIGESGVSRPNYRAKWSEQSNDVERLSNRVSAEVLVPGADFAERWKPGLDIEGNIRQLATRYKVSRFVVLRQAYDLGLISRDAYRTRYDAYLSQGGRGAESAGGNFYSTLLARNSASLTGAIVGALSSGRLTYQDAARLLNVKTGTLDNIVKHVAQGSRHG